MLNDNITTYDELAAEIKKLGDVGTIQMLTLRTIHGADRLGYNVVTNIQDELEKVGLGYAPSRLPNDKSNVALLFTKGSTLARILGAVQTVTSDTDDELRPLLGDTTAGHTLKRIRELVCE